MAIDAIVRASFQSSPDANHAVNKALVGHATRTRGVGPFVRVNTQVFVASAAPDAAVHSALMALMNEIGVHSAKLDFLSITVTTRKQRKKKEAPLSAETDPSSPLPAGPDRGAAPATEGSY